MPKPPLYDVIGIGHAMVDLTMQVEEQTLAQLNLAPGSMTLIDQKEQERLMPEFSKSVPLSGGSIANTIKGLSRLNHRVKYIGKIGQDSYGELFSKDMQSQGVHYDTPHTPHHSTGSCFVFITPDGERTMQTHLGAGQYIQVNDLDAKSLNQNRILYLEGYLWDDEDQKDIVQEAARITNESWQCCALNLSDSQCVQRHRESFLFFIQNEVNILFGNEKEINTLCPFSSRDELFDYLPQLCPLAVITYGEKGSYVITRKNRFSIPALCDSNAVDSTGAGDLYVSGFLHGYTHGLNLKTCGYLGALCAKDIISHTGCDLSSHFNATFLQQQLKNTL